MLNKEMLLGGAGDPPKITLAITEQSFNGGTCGAGYTDFSGTDHRIDATEGDTVILLVAEVAKLWSTGEGKMRTALVNLENIEETETEYDRYGSRTIYYAVIDTSQDAYAEYQYD